MLTASWSRARSSVATALRKWVWAPQPVPLRYKRQTIWIMATTVFEQKYRVRAAAKEPWTIEWLEGHVKPGEVLYDIGANVGAFSLIAARQCRAQVVAFEPGFANYARLCENIRLNKCDGEIIPLPWLLADTPGIRSFDYRSTEPGQSRHVMSADAWKPAAADATDYRQPMAAIPLDQAVALFGLPAPHHIKLDVDGAEAQVLAGAAATLRGTQLKSVLIEADAATWDAVTDHLRAAGLVLTKRHERDKPHAPWYGLFERA